MKKLLLSFLLLSILSPQCSICFAQGSLTPPGAPAATMKSLDQVRSTGTAINATNTPGDANYHFVISAAGSYFLTGNLAVTKTNGIHVTVPGVTIDLNGFQISRSAGSGGDGVTLDATAHRCTINTGSISGFAYGLHCLLSGTHAHGGSFVRVTAAGCSSFGISAGDGWQLEGCHSHDNAGTAIFSGNNAILSNCVIYNNTGSLQSGLLVGNSSTLTNCTAYNTQGGGVAVSIGNYSSVINCTASNNGDSGFSAGANCTMTNCSASGNVADGIIAANGATLINCSVSGNQGIAGILVGSGSALTNCNANANTNTASPSYGIDAGAGSTVTGCTAQGNLNTNGSPSESSGVGIRVDDGSTVNGCTVKNNKGDGIQAGANCLLINNAASLNGMGNTGTFGDGIHTTNENNRIDGNQVISNRGYGIHSSTPTADYILRNTAFGNGGAVVSGANANYFPDAGPFFGPLSQPNTATSPWANF